MTEDRWLTDSEQTAWRDWLSVQSRLPAALNRQLQREQQLSLPDFDVLVHLSEAPDQRLRISALAAVLRWEQSRMSHHLRRMADRGLVRREPCPEDARGWFICLTEAGRQRIEAAAPGHAALVRRLMFERLDRAEFDTFSTVIRTILDALEDEEKRA